MYVDQKPRVSSIYLTTCKNDFFLDLTILFCLLISEPVTEVAGGKISSLLYIVIKFHTFRIL